MKIKVLCINLMQSGVVGHFVFEELDKDRKSFAGLGYSQFLSRMDKTDEYFIAFKKYLSEIGVDLDMSKNKPLVKRYLAAEFAAQLYDQEKYYELTPFCPKRHRR